MTAANAALDPTGIQATDSDNSAGSVSCSIVSGNTLSLFKMNSNNLRVDTNAAIEPDQPTGKVL